jgi:aminoglycoside phosphotransferase (APT) family kinase protein
VPPDVRAAFEKWAGARVLTAVSQPSGFSPGVAARLKLSDARGVFVKAIGPTPNPDSPAIHRREARIVAALPDHVPVPRLLWTHDGGAEGWVVLAFEEVAGRHPFEPWRLDELDRVLGACAELCEALTPSPLSVEDAGLASEKVRARICGWQRLQHEPHLVRRLDAWSQEHLHALAELESHAPAAVHGQTLLHFDIRADNILLDDEHVWFFDWPAACIGAPWFDVVAFVPSVTMQGGPSAADVWDRYSGGRSVAAELVTQSLAAVAGYFTRESLLSAPPGLPTLRAFQAAQGVIARRWLAERIR